MNMREKMTRALLAEMQRQFPTITSSSEDGKVLEFLPCVDAILDAMREPSEGVLNETYHSDIFDMDSWKPKEIWQAMIDAIKAGK